jgi:hypothetical protein
VDNLLASIEAIGDVAIVGGALRDWLLGYEPRDLDLVVDVGHSALADVLEPLAERRTRFGGYHLRVGGCQLDIWSLETTWAFNSLALHKQPILPELPRTAFFNLDAVALRLSDGEVFECGFFDGIERRVLSVVFEKNPFPALCVVRAFGLAKRYGLGLDSGVVSYVRRVAELGVTWDELNKAQLSHYGVARVTPADVLPLIPSELSDRFLSAGSGDSSGEVARLAGAANS